MTWIRLASVTHSFDQNQRLNTLAFTKGPGRLERHRAGECQCLPARPLHALRGGRRRNALGRTYRAHFRPVMSRRRRLPRAAVLFNEARPGPVEKDAQTLRTATKPPVTVGITPTCLYGLAGCWGGAKGALRRLTGVETVLEEANAYTSTASVFLKDDRLPDLDIWRREFGTYRQRVVLASRHRDDPKRRDRTDRWINSGSSATRDEAIRPAGAARSRQQSAMGLRHEVELATGARRSQCLRETEANSELPESARLLDCSHRYASEE